MRGEFYELIRNRAISARIPPPPKNPSRGLSCTTPLETNPGRAAELQYGVASITVYTPNARTREPSRQLQPPIVSRSTSRDPEVV